MSMKNIAEFIRTKINSFVKKNTSVEDQYAKAAEQVISQITRLETAHVKSVSEEKRLRQYAKISKLRRGEKIMKFACS